MTDLVVDLAADCPSAAPPKLVGMREFGVGKRSTVGISVATALLILGAWQGASSLHLAPHLFLPSPSEVYAAAQSVFEDGYANATLWEHVSASLARILIAAVIAIGLGAPIGLVMGLSRWAKGIFDAPIEFYWPLPPLAYLPLMIIWLGIGEASKITLLALAMFAPVALSAQAAMMAMPTNTTSVARNCDADMMR